MAARSPHDLFGETFGPGNFSGTHSLAKPLEAKPLRAEILISNSRVLLQETEVIKSSVSPGSFRRQRFIKMDLNFYLTGCMVLPLMVLPLMVLPFERREALPGMTASFTTCDLILPHIQVTEHGGGSVVIARSPGDESHRRQANMIKI